MRWPRNLPWIDAFAALSAGALVLVLRGWLIDLYGMSRQLLTAIAVVNILYSLFGLILGPLRQRPAWLLTTLICANLFWAAVCMVLVVLAPASLTFWGYCQLIGEGVFVASLALQEWRHRSAILAPPLPTPS